MGDITYVIDKMNLPDITDEIKRTMRRSARDAVQLGYMLRTVMDKKLWVLEYDSYDDYLNEELQMDYTMASRFININKKYSVGHKSMDISSVYESYTQGALIEMLNMSQEELEQVTPDMTVRQIRDIKRQNRPKKQELEQQADAEQQVQGQIRMEETGIESPRTYQVNDEMEPMDAELIRYLVQHVVNEEKISCEDFMDDDKESLNDNIFSHAFYNNTYYSLYAESESESGSTKKPGYVEIAYEKDTENPIIFIENSYFVRLIIKELRERRDMCCYNTEPCTYQKLSGLCKAAGGECPSSCCMTCEKSEKCDYACWYSSCGKSIQNQPEQDAEKIATSQSLSEQVNTCDTINEEDLEEDMNLLVEIQEPEQPEVLTVPVDLGDEETDDIIDGVFQEIMPEGQEQIPAAVMEEEGNGQLPEKKADMQEKNPVSPYGFEKTEYPVGSLLNTEGCGHKYNCYSCAQKCDIRQKNRYCVLAPLGNPYDCETMELIDTLREKVGDTCQFVDNSRAYHTAGSHEAEPCCRDCLVPCSYMCKRAAAALAEQKEAVENDIAVSADEVLKNMSMRLNDMLERPEKFSNRQIEEQKVLVAAVASMVSDLQNAELEKELEKQKGVPVQPELPELKNNDSRKAWLEAYKEWGLWYHDENIDVNYYKYDFSDGSRLIVSEYPERESIWDNKRQTQIRYHFLEKGKKKYGGKKTYDEKYREAPNSITELVEWLKNFQKKKDK